MLDAVRIRKALDAAGYTEAMPTEEELQRCFLDYAAAGYWSDLTLEDAREEIHSGIITANEMIKALMIKRGEVGIL